MASRGNRLIKETSLSVGSGKKRLTVQFQLPILIRDSVGIKYLTGNVNLPFLIRTDENGINNLTPVRVCVASD